MINLILFGPPGSGKGTQASNLVGRYQLYHISTGDMFRAEIGNSTPLGLAAKSYMDKGELVPDSVTIDMLRNKVEQTPDVEGFIFDGFPRTVAQAEALDAMLSESGQEITALVALQVDDEELKSRLLQRGATSGRPDDVDEAIILNRIEVYKKNTTPVADYYAEKGKALYINGVGSILSITERLFTAIDEVIDNTKA